MTPLQMIAEWRKGCSCAADGHPEQCPACTVALIDALERRLSAAPLAIMDTRDALGICSPTEEDFPALYALQGKRVRLVLDEVTHNSALTRRP